MSVLTVSHLVPSFLVGLVNFPLGFRRNPLINTIKNMFIHRASTVVSRYLGFSVSKDSVAFAIANLSCSAFFKLLPKIETENDNNDN